jgi:peptidoglycan/LPS O-acetylase OafA/YrhL
MFGLGSHELIIILTFLFLPSLVTGTLAKRKGRRFWLWTTFGFLICSIGGFGFGMLLVVSGIGEPIPFFHLYVGALAGPLVAFLVKPSK